MTDDKNLGSLIRERFGYLMTDHGFVDDPDTIADDIYSQVLFEKNGWRISIATTAHGTRISLGLISPKGDSGFLSHYFNAVDKDYKTGSWTENLEDSLRCESEFLRKHERDILAGDSERLEKVLELIGVEHEKFIKPLLRRPGEGNPASSA